MSSHESLGVPPDATPGAAEGALLFGSGGEESVGAEAAGLVDAALVVEDDEVVVPSPVNYDDEGLTEVTIGDFDYRFDSGKQGTALCLSRRAAGSYRWGYLGEVRWDGRDLRSRALERKLLGELSLALRNFQAESSM